MKSFTLLSAVLALGLTLVIGDAEAKRLGGGRSFGMQRDTVSTQKAAPAPTTAAPTQAQAPMAGAKQPTAGAPQAQPRRSWMGPLAGLAAGLGLAALASHFGFGEELASMLLIGLAVMAVLLVVGFIMRRRAAAQAPAGLQYAGAGAPAGASFGRDAAPVFPQGGSSGAVADQPVRSGGGSLAVADQPAGSGGGYIPADFDAAGFARHAKVNFIRLQAAYDAGNLDDIRDFTTPEMFAEIRMDLSERGQASQETDVVSIEAEVIDVTEDAARYVVSVRFSGLVREAANAQPAPVDEVWHMVKPRDGRGGWVIAGIQQVQ